MHRRVTLATAIAGTVLTMLAGCGSDGSTPESSPSSSSPSATSQAPSADPSSSDALLGDWEIPAEQYVLHLKEDGTFFEDFQGVVDFRTGKYTVEGDTLSLVGDDGNTDKATVVGDTLEFTLGTATRLE